MAKNNKCSDCGLSEWACNRLQDLVYDDMSVSDRRKLAVEIRQDTSELIAREVVKELEGLKAKSISTIADWQVEPEQTYIVEIAAINDRIAAILEKWGLK